MRSPVPYFALNDMVVPMNELEILTEEANKGLERKGLKGIDDYEKRLQHELTIIENLGFAPYFLVMWDIASFARRQKILFGPGRGSGAGSLLNYVLGITMVDPIKYGLHFERFLNPERVSPPDVDWDCSKRDDIIDYLTTRYGKDRVARVGSLNFLRTKSAIKDVGRVLNWTFAEVENLTKLVPPPIAGLWDSFESESEAEPRLRSPEFKEIMKPVEKLWGVVRSYGTHAGGIAIAPGPIDRYIPLYCDKDGNSVSQFDWRDLEAIGLLKFDILGLSTLEVIDLCLQYMGENGQHVDLEALEDGDEAAYNLICQGDLDGVFQLGGSDSMKQLTLKIQPKNIRDLSFITALFRPGPLTKNPETGKSMVDIAIARKTKKEPVSYIHPMLEPILSETLGVIVYQEQSMQIAVDLAGFSGARADTLRKAIGKKSKELMDSLATEFTEGCFSYGIIPDVSKEIWNAIEGSAKYSFNAAHSISYSFITYWTAYLKAHFPLEFLAALLSCETNPDTIVQYASMIKERGIEILPPSVNYSGFFHRPEGKAIRFGLGHIKGMPSAIAKEITEWQNLPR